MQTFNLDISVKRVIPLLYVKQRDVGTKILINITNNGDTYAVPANASLSVWYSGTSGEGNYTTIGDKSAFVVKGNTVTVELIMQMLNNPGGGKMCLVLNSADGSQLGLWDIPYFVEAIPGADSDEAMQYYTAFLETVTSVENAARRAEEAAEKLEGNLVLKKGEGVDSVVQDSTTGNDNVAYSPVGTAFGVNTIAGIKGFYIINVDTENLLITVDDKELTEKAAKVYAVGDVLQFDASQHYYNRLKITGLSTNSAGQSVINIESLAEDALKLSLGADPKENYCWVIGKNYGEIVLIAKASYTEGEGTKAMGRAAHSEGKETQAIGNYAHAEGRAATANYCAHAEGYTTNASGNYSHAEGAYTIASGEDSHAEGKGTKASGSYAHSEGSQTEASGPTAHAEGAGSKATGNSAHAEGSGTIALSWTSHAEGYHTIAASRHSHVQGRFNIPDYKIDSEGNVVTDENGNPVPGNNYAHIVGGGVDDARRKNIHTIDWNGNPMFAGDHITLGNVQIYNSNGSVAIKTCENGIWGPLEYLNPPMAMGVEYRTTERYNGKAVYAKLIDAGFTYKGQTNIEHKLAVITPISIEVTNNNQEVVTTGGNVTNLVFNRTYIHVTCAVDHGNLVFLVKYTKEA